MHALFRETMRSQQVAFRDPMAAGVSNESCKENRTNEMKTIDYFLSFLLLLSYLAGLSMWAVSGEKGFQVASISMLSMIFIRVASASSSKAKGEAK